MQAVIQYIEKELNGLYPKTEIQGFSRLIIEHIYGFNYTQFLLHKNETIESSKKVEIEKIILRLKIFEPIQYILGETEFYGLKLNVNPSVLIPRPETEELIQWILETNSIETPRILDIGTGSGCIALVLKSQIQEAEIFANDISEEALIKAKQNANLNKLEIDFLHADILIWEQQSWEMFDVIVSNPPYVRELEKEKMLANVLDFEPEKALFVSNSDPLIFYRRIGEFAQKYLKNNGLLFFEINEYLRLEMINLLDIQGFQNITVKKDLLGKNRMLCCRKLN